MLTSQKLQVKASERRERMLELAGADELDDEQTVELRKLEADAKASELQLRAALTAESAAAAEAAAEAPPGLGSASAGEGDKELRALRGRVSVGEFLSAALTGREVRGAGAEYLEAVRVPAGAHIPLSLFEPTVEERAAAVEHRVATGAPGGVAQAVNLAPIYPAIFARAILPRIGVSMPMVESGHSAVALINTSLSAAAVAAGAEKDATAATWTVDSTAPHRVSGVLEVRIEDVAAVGTASFESALRQNLMLALSDRLDHLGLTGDGLNANPQGLLTQLANPADPAAVADFDYFVEAAVGGIDGGPWAESLTDVMLLVNAETMRLAETTFALSGDATKGIASKSTSSASYLRRESRGLVASSRMPAKVANIAQAIRVRAMTMGLDGVNAVELARCPVWSYLSVDDIYTKATSGTRVFSVHALIGDVMLTQPDAFDRVDFKVS